KKLQCLSKTLDFTPRINPNLIVGGTSLGTHHPGGLVLQEQPSEVRETYVKVTTGTSTHVDLRSPAWSTFRARGSNPVVQIHWTRWRRQHLVLERGPRISQECSMPINPRENAPPAMQPTSGGAYRPPLPFPSFGDGSIPFHTQGRYWSLLNDPGLTPPPSNPRTLVETPEAF
ncbi:hypothetical protein BHM03_00036067, partial [Ensete ventricosum]